jgi:hypothetical protein
MLKEILEGLLERLQSLHFYTLTLSLTKTNLVER